jgi:MFS family permease
LYEKYYKPEDKNRAMSTITAMVDVGIVGSCLFGGMLYKDLGMRSVFLVSAIISAVGLVVSFFVKDEPTQKIEPTMEEFYQTVKNKELLVSALLCNLVNIVVAGTAIAFTPKIAIDLGATGVELGVLNAVFMVSSALSSLFVASKRGKKLGNTRIVVAGFIILTAYAASIPFVRSIPVLMLVQLLGGLGYAPLTSIFMANSVRHLPYEQQATGMGYYQSLYSVGSAIGPILLGALADVFSYKIAFLLVSVIALIGIPCTLLASHKKLMD